MANYRDSDTSQPDGLSPTPSPALGAALRVEGLKSSGKALVALIAGFLLVRMYERSVLTSWTVLGTGIALLVIGLFDVTNGVGMLRLSGVLRRETPLTPQQRISLKWYVQRLGLLHASAKGSL